MKVELQKKPDQVWSALYHRFCETMEMSKRKNGGTVNLNSSAIVGLVDLPIVYRLWNGRKCSAVPLARGLSRLRLNKNSIVPIRINDFGHEIDNADRELYERSDTICQKNEVFSYRV